MSRRLRSWVAFDENGFPIGFMDADHYARADAVEEFPSASRLRLVEGEQRARLLDEHAKGPTTPKLFDDTPPTPAVDDAFDRVDRLIADYGYQRVAELVSEHAPIPEVRLSQVDAPPTAERAGDRHATGDPSRYGANSLKGQVLLHFDAVGGVSDADEIIEWWTELNPGASHGRLESLRRRVDELFQIGHLDEVDVSGHRRRLAISPIAGQAAVRSLNETGWSKRKGT